MWIAIILAVVVIAALVLYLRRPGASTAAAPDEATAAAEAGGGFGFRPPASDFHVAEGEARVFFEVPLPAGEPDPVLTNILMREAVEVLREKRSHLPLDGVSVVRAYATRNGEPVEVGTLTLDGPGELPPPTPAEHPFATHHGPDLFEEFGAAPPAAPGLDVRAPSDDLGPVGTELELTGVMEAGLRAQGLDPFSAPTSTLVPALLRLAGYTVTGADYTYTATKGGERTYVEIVDHAAGDHPELSERAVNEFMVHFGQAGANRGLLFTAKYGPFMIYDKERREKRVRFVTRERFQSFVNAVSI